MPSRHSRYGGWCRGGPSCEFEPMPALGKDVASIIRSLARWALALALGVLMLPGCATHSSLRRHTVAANLTVADLYYGQVLDNLARFNHNPAAMPSFSVVSAGTVHKSGNSWLPGTTCIQPLASSQSSRANQAAIQVPGWTRR